MPQTWYEQQSAQSETAHAIVQAHSERFALVDEFHWVYFQNSAGAWVPLGTPEATTALAEVTDASVFDSRLFSWNDTRIRKVKHLVELFPGRAREMPRVPAIMHNDGVHAVSLCLNWHCDQLYHRHGAGYGHRVEHCISVANGHADINGKRHPQCDPKEVANGYVLAPATELESLLIQRLLSFKKRLPYYHSRDIERRRHHVRKRLSSTLQQAWDNLEWYGRDLLPPP